MTLRYGLARRIELVLLFLPVGEMIPEIKVFEMITMENISRKDEEGEDEGAGKEGKKQKQKKKQD